MRFIAWASPKNLLGDGEAWASAGKRPPRIPLGHRASQIVPLWHRACGASRHRVTNCVGKTHGHPRAVHGQDGIASGVPRASTGIHGQPRAVPWALRRQPRTCSPSTKICSLHSPESIPSSGDAVPRVLPPRDFRRGRKGSPQGTETLCVRARARARALFLIVTRGKVAAHVLHSYAQEGRCPYDHRLRAERSRRICPTVMRRKVEVRI